MDEKTRLELALFRFSLIAPLVNGSLETSVQEYIEQVASKTYDVPGLGRREFSPRTLLAWRSEYLRHGLDGLKVKPRRDRGRFRRLTQEAQHFIRKTLQRNPRRTATSIYEDLAGARLLGHPPVSLSTVQRFCRTVELPSEQTPDRRRFTFARANACWQSDLCVGPYLYDPGTRRKTKTYLIAFLDDASRLWVDYAFATVQNYPAFERVFISALKKRGIPQKLYVDNGKIYHAGQLRLSCARLGIALSHSQVYQPQGRGKIERAFRTLREQCFSRLEPEDLTSLDALNAALRRYIEQVYHARPHSALEGKTPLERFLHDQEHLRLLSPEHIDRAFLHEQERRVQNDATFSLKGVVFEAPGAFIGSRVRVRFRPDDLRQAWIEQPDGALCAVTPVRPVDNAHIPRNVHQRTIDYSTLFHGHEEDASK